MGGQNGSQETSEVAMMWLEDGRRRAGMWAGPGSDSLVSLDLQRPGLCPSHRGRVVLLCGEGLGKCAWAADGVLRPLQAGSVPGCGWRALPWAWPPHVPASAGPGLLLGPSAVSVPPCSPVHVRSMGSGSGREVVAGGVSLRGR